MKTTSLDRARDFAHWFHNINWHMNRPWVHSVTHKLNKTLCDYGWRASKLLILNSLDINTFCSVFCILVQRFEISLWKTSSLLITIYVLIAVGAIFVPLHLHNLSLTPSNLLYFPKSNFIESASMVFRFLFTLLSGLLSNGLPIVSPFHQMRYIRLFR